MDHIVCAQAQKAEGGAGVGAGAGGGAGGGGGGEGGGTPTGGVAEPAPPPGKKAKGKGKKLGYRVHTEGDPSTIQRSSPIIPIIRVFQAKIHLSIIVGYSGAVIQGPLLYPR